MPNVRCAPCRNTMGADEAVFREGPLECPICHGPMRGDPSKIPAAPPGFDQFDHTYTPEEAQTIIDTIPADSYHWRDIPRLAPQAVARYTQIMSEGRWRNETIENGFYEHPIRWDEQGRITHGVMRLLACRDSGVPFRAVTFAPQGLLQELLWTG